MLITLLKDHVTPTAHYKAGETIEVSEQTYDWLMSVYAEDRTREAELLKQIEPKRKA